MKSKNIFVLWSGGLDSTYLVQKLLDENKDARVVTGYVNILNNYNKSIAEKRARNAMIPIFENKYGNRFTDLGIIHKAEVLVHNHWSPLVQMPIWFNALIASVPMDTTEVCLGYVMNDCAISYLNELKAMFRCFSKNISTKPFPKVTFPLSKVCKEDIVYNINKDLKSHVTWCEMPIIKYKEQQKECKNPEVESIAPTDYSIDSEVESITPCGYCVPCKHSPILELDKPLTCENKFVETYNKTEETEEIEASKGQKFFDFV